eukprot:scaffold4493_cov390-Prasinococcus_capsulatus_cf.AAC.9
MLKPVPAVRERCWRGTCSCQALNSAYTALSNAVASFVVVRTGPTRIRTADTAGAALHVVRCYSTYVPSRLKHLLATSLPLQTPHDACFRGFARIAAPCAREQTKQRAMCTCSHPAPKRPRAASTCPLASAAGIRAFDRVEHGLAANALPIGFDASAQRNERRDWYRSARRQRPRGRRAGRRLEPSRALAALPLPLTLRRMSARALAQAAAAAGLAAAAAALAPAAAAEDGRRCCESDNDSESCSESQSEMRA